MNTKRDTTSDRRMQRLGAQPSSVTNRTVDTQAGRHRHTRPIDRSTRRRIMACLRLAHRVLGMKRDKLGLGLLGSALSVRGLSVSIGVATISAVAAPNFAMAQFTTNGGAAPTATGTDASAGGSGASASGDSGVAVGAGASETSAAGIAIGQTATVTGASGPGGDIAIGKNAQASEANASFSAIAIGYQASATTNAFGSPIALGYNAQANITGGNGSPIAIGWGSNATPVSGQGSNVAIGDNATATGADAIALGGVPNGIGSAATGDQSVAIGPSALSSGNGSVGIGNGANAAVANSVAVGSGSTADRAGLAGAAEAFSGTAVPSTQGAVSVGSAGNERQIINVAGGTQPTDAVNVRQLSAVGSNLAGSLGGGAAFDPTTGAYTAPAFTTAAGTTATNVQAALGNETAAITSLGNGTASKLGGGVTYSPTTGQLTNGFTVGGTTYGDVASAISGTAANDGLVQRTGTPNQVAVTAPGGTGTNPGAAQVVTNVAAGQLSGTSTDAVNGSQLFTTNSAVNTNATNLATLGSTTAANLGDGATYNAATGITGFSSSVAGGTQTSVGGALSALDTAAQAQGSGLANALGGGAAVAPNGTVTAPSFAVGAGTYSNVAAALTAVQSGAPVQYSTAGAPTTANGLTPSNDETLVGANAGAPVALHNVAPAALTATSSDAVNGSQLYATNQNVAGLTNGTAGLVQQDPTTRAITVGAGTDGTSVGFANNSGAARTLTGVAAGSVAAGSTDAIDGAQLRGSIASVASSLGGGSGVNPDGTVSAPTYNVAGTNYNNVGSALNALTGGSTTAGIEYFHANSTGPDSSATGTDAVAIGSGSTSTHAGGVALGSGASATRAGLAGGTEAFSGMTVASTQGALSVGAAGAERQITNVAGGTQATDAVNVRQLSAVGSNLAGSLGGGAAFDPTTGAYTTPVFDTAAGTTATTVQAALGNETAAITSLGTSTASKLGGGVTYNAATGQLSNGFTVGATTYSDVASAISGAAANDGVVQRTGTPNEVAVTAATGTGTNPGAAQVVTNVAAGQVVAGSTQAVNGSQLAGTAASVASGLGGGSTVNPDGTVSGPAYHVGGQTYDNVGSALAASNGLGVQYTPDGSGNPTSAVDLTKGGTLGPVAVTGLGNATTSTGAVALGQMPAQYSTAGAPTTANPATPSNDVTLVGLNAGAPVGLHDVAAGALTATSTDAVNGSQLYATNQSITNLTNGTAGLVQQDPATRTITVGAGTDGTTVGFANNAGAARALTGVAAGQVATGSTQAINGGQLASTAASVASGLGGGAVVNPDGTISAPSYNVANGTYSNVGSALTALNTGIATGKLGAFVADNTSGRAAPQASGTNAAAGGFGAVASGAGSTVLGSNATDNGTADATVLGSDGSVTQAGGVALGSGSTATRAGLAGASEAFSGTAVGSTQAAVSVGSGGNERQITNVAGGTQATDAVNVRQLGAVGNALAGSLGGGAGFDPTTGAYTAPSYTVGGQTYGDVGTALAASDSLAVQYTANATGAATNAIDLTKGGALNPVTMTGLAAGAVTATSTDAVNGSQLYATDQQLAAIAGGSAGLVQQNPTTRAITVGAGTDGTSVGFANEAGTARTLTGVAAGQVASGSTQAVNGGQLFGTAASVATALGGGSIVNSDGTVSAPAYNVNGQSYSNVGGAITALDNTGVKYDVDPGTGARGQSITLAGGDPNQPVVIHNVAAGTAPTDAANVGQVQNAVTQANQYTNAAVSNVESQIAGVTNGLSNLQSNIAETRQEARSGAAVGLAAASLRYDDTPGKFSIAGGGGYWRGESAAAFGLGYTLPDGHFRLNASAATTGSNVGFGAGATYTFN